MKITTIKSARAFLATLSIADVVGLLKSEPLQLSEHANQLMQNLVASYRPPICTAKDYATNILIDPVFDSSEKTHRSHCVCRENTICPAVYHLDKHGLHIICVHPECSIKARFYFSTSRIEELANRANELRYKTGAVAALQELAPQNPALHVGEEARIIMEADEWEMGEPREFWDEEEHAQHRFDILSNCTSCSHSTPIDIKQLFALPERVTTQPPTAS